MSAPRYSNVKYMLVELVVNDEHHVQFAEQMPGIIGHITARYGWEFVYGAYPLSGRMNKFVHIWRIKSEADVVKLMVDGAIAFTRPGDAEEDIEFAQAYRNVQDLISSTRHVFMSALPHDPTQIGEQSDIIVVDENGDLALIVESRLEDPALDIPELHPEQEPALDDYLRKGVSCGLPNDPDTNSKSFFYNLAALKPLSVFQTLNLTREGGATVVIPPAPGPLAGAGSVVLAARNGKVYELDAVNMAKVAEPIPAENAGATAAILESLIEGRVPLATIPTPHIVAIGEGCLCFVINLQTFA
jgi:hypothetical protein